MSTEDSRAGSGPTRRTLITGATAAGLGALTATFVPQPAEAAITTPIKLVCAIRRRSDLTPRQFYDYWLYKHGPLATDQVKKLGAYRYVQSHTTEAALNLTLRETRGNHAAVRRSDGGLVPLGTCADYRHGYARRSTGEPQAR